MSIERSIERRNEARSVHPICPKCGESSQIQLVSWMTAPFGWKCRTCKAEFNQEHLDVTASMKELVRWLTSADYQPWTRTMSIADTARRTLVKMVQLGLIEGRPHPLTSSGYPTVFRVGGELFGRLDGIDGTLFGGDNTSETSVETITTKDGPAA